MRMKYIFSIISILTLISASYAAVSIESTKLENLRQAVENGQGTLAEKEYLNAFPATFEKFKKTFNGNEDNLDELYSTHFEHLALLENLYKKYPEKVLSIWMGVATNGHWDADAIGILQHQLAEYGAANTRELAQALLSKPVNQRLSIIAFLADVENHDVYEEYRLIMKNLKVLRYNELYSLFDAAKKTRIKKVIINKSAHEGRGKATAPLARS